ncbi:O-methyltransferase [Corynebacterium poyangense]|uniref:O-methyltransferase n=1 Tax=Corynebacterium poyangense TaxID=2684405 RepID=A0A7H0SN75_9CORY|nr:class I SAM-dependent methyltransferase [Corynebacterium poyangense]MBZ8177022.1 O-methyltransferase [Corynebacterium poyangense]QNQ90000.1 O-methyltransferase [Corynebacterium poyangense]
MSDTAFDALSAYIAESTPAQPALREALRGAEEYGLNTPDEATGQLLGTLASLGPRTTQERGGGAVAITPALGPVGLHILRGLSEKETLTCIDPEVEHQKMARDAFRAAGYSSTKARFLTARPLDVMKRLATGSYHLIYADVPAEDLPAIYEAAWPLLSTGGVLIFADALLDGTVADESRKDRATQAARQLWERVQEDDQALVTRLPLGAGMMLLTRR